MEIFEVEFIEGFINDPLISFNRLANRARRILAGIVMDFSIPAIFTDIRIEPHLFCSANKDVVKDFSLF